MCFKTDVRTDISKVFSSKIALISISNTITNNILSKLEVSKSVTLQTILFSENMDYS